MRNAQKQDAPKMILAARIFTVLNRCAGNPQPDNAVIKCADGRLRMIWADDVGYCFPGSTVVYAPA